MNNLEPYISKKDIVVVVVAHPDDETVFHGELIRQSVLVGAEVHLIYATAGENSTINNRFWQPNFVRCGLRKREANKAADRMGVKTNNVRHLDLPNDLLQENSDQLTTRIRQLIADTRATVVVSVGPNGQDGHLDHIAVSNSVAKLKSTDSKMAILQLDDKSNGQLVLAVNKQAKIHATIAHFSQFPGFMLFGLLIVLPKTRNYLSNYKYLLQKETYNPL